MGHRSPHCILAGLKCGRCASLPDAGTGTGPGSADLECEGRRVRAHLLWWVNPLMLWALMASGHNDVLAAAAAASALVALRRADSLRGLLAGALLGLATAVKAPHAPILVRARLGRPSLATRIRRPSPRGSSRPHPRLHAGRTRRHLSHRRCGDWGTSRQRAVGNAMVKFLLRRWGGRVSSAGVNTLGLLGLRSSGHHPHMADARRTA